MNKRISNYILYFLFKVPLINALTLLLLMGELAKRHSNPPFHTYYVYVHMFISFLFGVALSNNYLRKDCLLFFAASYTHLAYLFGTYSDELRYRNWLIQKVLIKYCGCIGSFLILSSQLTGYSCFKKFASFKENGFISYTGQCLLGIYALCSCHNTMFSKQNLDLAEFVFDHGIMQSFFNGFCSLLFICAFVLISSQYKLKWGIFMLGMATVTQLVVSDLNFRYWHVRLGCDWWLQIRLIVDSLSICGICVLFFIK